MMPEWVSRGNTRSTDSLSLWLMKMGRHLRIQYNEYSSMNPVVGVAVSTPAGGGSRRCGMRDGMQELDGFTARAGDGSSR